MYDIKKDVEGTRIFTEFSWLRIGLNGGLFVLCYKGISSEYGVSL